MYEKFKKLCAEKGVTPYVVSKHTGIAQATLTEWKQGKYTPKIDKIMKIAQFFNVDVSYFYKEQTMNKASIRKVLTRYAGSEFINKEQLKRCMGWGNDRADKTLSGLDYITLGRTRQYDTDEVATRILEQKRGS